MALNLGVLPSAIERMSEAEFIEAQVYAAQRMLPFRRLETQLARVCMYVAKNKDASLSDFMITIHEDTEAESPVEDQRQAIGWTPRGKRRKRET